VLERLSNMEEERPRRAKPTGRSREKFYARLRRFATQFHRAA